MGTIEEFLTMMLQIWRSPNYASDAEKYKAQADLFDIFNRLYGVSDKLSKLYYELQEKQLEERENATHAIMKAILDSKKKKKQ